MLSVLNSVSSAVKCNTTPVLKRWKGKITQHTLWRDCQVQIRRRNTYIFLTSFHKAVYVTLPVKSPVVAKIKKIVLKSHFSDSDVLEFEETASRNGFSGYFDADSWIPFLTLQTAIPVSAYNEQLFLRQHRSITLSDDSLFYAARILDYKVTDEISPLEIQRDNIRVIILNHRKIDILNKLQSDLLKEAEDGGYVERML